MPAILFRAGNCDTVKISGELIQQLFYGHIAAQCLVFCLKDFAHPSFAELVCDLVVPERLADHAEALHVDSWCNAIIQKLGYCNGIGYCRAMLILRMKPVQTIRTSQDSARGFKVLDQLLIISLHTKNEKR